MKKIEQINNFFKPYYSLLTMLVFFIMLFIGIYKFVFTPSDLQILIQNENVSYPSSIGKYYESVNSYILKKDTLSLETNVIYNFLIRTTDYKSIILENTSSKTLRGVKFKQINSDAITAWSISSDFLTNSEELLLRKNLVFDETRKIIYLKKDIEIPPHRKVFIKLWGNFKEGLIDNNVIVNYNGGDGHIEKSYTVSGLKGYFVNYSFELIVIMLLIFIIVYYVGIKYNNENDN